jgi:hypothetical protein
VRPEDRIKELEQRVWEAEQDIVLLERDSRIFVVVAVLSCLLAVGSLAVAVLS